MNFWHEKYITPETGLLVEDNKLKKGVKKVLNRDYDTRSYYENNLDMEQASQYLCELIKEIL